MCPNSDSMPFSINSLEITNPSVNKFIVKGTIVIRENITNNIRLSMDVTRCNLDMSHCEQFDKVVIPKLCDKINDKSSLWAPMTKAIRPRMKCPIHIGEYEIQSGTFDLNLVSRMNIEGFRWIVKNRILHRQGDKKKTSSHNQDRILFCLEGDVSVTAAKRRV